MPDFDPERMRELADRCEQATRPDRELDEAVHIAVTTFEPRYGGVGWPAGTLVVPAFPGWVPLPAYTASLHDAECVVPASMEWGCQRIRPDGYYAWLEDVSDPLLEPIYDARAATVELALTAAALRARHAIASA